MSKKQNKSQKQPQVAPQADPVDDAQPDPVRHLESTTDTRFNIDTEFSKLFSLITQKQYDELKADILSQNKCRDKLIVGKFTDNDGTVKECLLDGHTRLCIIEFQKNIGNEGIKYEIDTTLPPFPNRQAVKLWMIQNQLSRRNVSAFQRVEMALEFKEDFAKEAKEKQKAGGGAVKVKSPEPGMTTRDRLAKIAGVSGKTIDQVEFIISEASEAVKEKLRNGDISINAAYNRYKSQGASEQSNSTRKKKAKDRLDLWRKSRPRKDAYKKDYREVIASLDTFEKSLTQEEDRVKLWKSLYMYWLFDESRLGADEEMKKLRDAIFETDKKDSD